MYHANPKNAYIENEKMHNIGDVIRLKKGPSVGQNKLEAPKFTLDPFKIIDSREHRKTYKVQNLNNPNDIRFCHHRHTKLVITEKGRNKVKKLIDQASHPMTTRSRAPKDKQIQSSRVLRAQRN